MCVWVRYFSILKESGLKGGQRCCGFFLVLDSTFCLKESNEDWNQGPFKAGVNECDGVLFKKRKMWWREEKRRRREDYQGHENI